LTQNKLNLGHPVDRDLRALEQIEHSIQAQLEFEHEISQRDIREIELAKCFPQGKFILRGTLEGFSPTIDREVTRSYLIQDGRKKGVFYINTLRKVCVAVDWIF
jgi:hypothetical protein